MIKNTRKYFSKCFGIVFFLSLFLFNFTHSLTNEEFLAKLPYNVNFTEAELKLLKTLSATDLEKIIKIATLIKQQSLEKSKILNNQKLAEQARLNAQNNGNNLNDPNNPNNPNNPANAQQKPSFLDTLFGKQPTATSPFQTPQTPFYNPATGQFQNTPANNGGILSSLVNSGALTSGARQTSGSSGDTGSNGGGETPSRQGSPSKCAGPNMKHSDAIQKLNNEGIKTPNTVTSFDGLPEGTVLWLKKLKDECKCNLSVNSATRSFGSTASARPNGHYVGNMVVDLSPDSNLNKFILKNGRPGGGRAGCSYTFKGVVYESEIGNCKIGATQGAHWHVDARNWDCT